MSGIDGAGDRHLSPASDVASVQPGELGAAAVDATGPDETHAVPIARSRAIGGSTGFRYEVLAGSLRGLLDEREGAAAASGRNDPSPAARPEPSAAARAEAQRDAKALHEAMEGIGTDDEAIFRILENRSPEELQRIRKAFDATYAEEWGSITGALVSELSSGELSRALAALNPRGPHGDADALEDAMSGPGADSKRLLRLLSNRTPKELTEIEIAYARKYGDSRGSLRLALLDELGREDYYEAKRALDQERLAFGSRDFERMLDAETGSVLHAGNRAEPLFDGVSSFAKRFELIEGAKESIHLQTFIFDSDETGWKMARALVDAKKRGVNVRVIYDGTGSFASSGSIFDLMREGGVELRKKSMLSAPNRTWHQKQFVVDGRAAIMGGMNIGDEYAFGGTDRRADDGKGWRDADVLLRGSAVRDAQKIFVKNWDTLGDPVPPRETQSLFPTLSDTAGSTGVRIVHHRPGEDGDQHLKALYVRAIETATDTIRIENAYFLPPKEIRQALVNAARRGVKVEIITNGVLTHDFAAVGLASRFQYDRFIRHGIKIYEQQAVTIHAKTATFDGKFSMIGSMNLNGRSDGRDGENVATLMDPDVARKLEERFEEGRSGASLVTPEDLEIEGVVDDLLQRGATWLRDSL